MTYDGQEARLNAGPLCFFLEYSFRDQFLFLVFLKQFIIFIG